MSGYGDGYDDAVGDDADGVEPDGEVGDRCAGCSPHPKHEGSCTQRVDVSAVTFPRGGAQWVRCGCSEGEGD